MLMRTNLLRNQRKQPLITRGGKPGQIVNPECSTKYLRGYNLARSAGQTTRITFAAPGTLAPKATVIIRIIEQNCAEKLIELRNAGTAAAPLQTLLVEKLNGVPTVGSLAVASGVLYGYRAAINGATAVDITGPDGLKFTIAYGYEWERTINAIIHPPRPTSALQIAASCAGRIPYGRAVVRNATLHEATIPRNQPGSVLESPYGEILTLPTGSVLETFAGIVVNREIDPQMIGSIQMSCCDDDDKVCKPDGVDCGECLDVHGPCCCAEIKVTLQLEPLPTGIAQPATFVDLPIFYRKAPNGTLTELGAFLVNPLAVDTTVSKAATNSMELLVVELLDVAKGLVIAQFRPIKA
jgi:hypothetical protein